MRDPVRVDRMLVGAGVAVSLMVVSRLDVTREAARVPRYSGAGVIEPDPAGTGACLLA